MPALALRRFHGVIAVLVLAARLCDTRLLAARARRAPAPVSAIGTTLTQPSGQGEIFSVGAPATGETLRQPGSSVVYLVRTWHGSYDSKVKSILRTWGGNLGASLVIVGDKYSVDPPVLGASRCGNDHSVGLACKDGFGLTLAAQALAITRSSWVFVVDDDVYVRTAAVEDALASRNATEPVMLGIPGCGPNLCEDGAGGICGGGGYALSHAALELMVADRPAQSLEAELAETCRGTGGGWDDISVTCAAKRRHIAVDSLDGLHGWRPQDNGELLRWIRSTSPLPLTFHYVDPSKMDYIHGEFGRLNSFVAVDSLNHTMGLEQHRAQVRRYVSTMNARHYSVKLA